jgi:hypothetical protein
MTRFENILVVLQISRCGGDDSARLTNIRGSPDPVVTIPHLLPYVVKCPVSYYT